MPYEGVKFKTEMIGKEIPDDQRLEELKSWCKLFHDNGLAPLYEGGSYGNLSFRIKKGSNSFIITASNSSLGESVSNDCFAIVENVDLEKGIVYAKGIRKPSSEAMLHYAIYNKRKDINAVFHGHCKKISLNPEKLGIPITKQEEPYGTKELVNRVLEILDNEFFLEMKNHGFLALGKTMEQAGELALRIYEKL